MSIDAKGLPMIARVWHGKTPRELAKEYREYVIRTGVADYLATQGNIGTQIWQRDEGEFTHIWTVTLWRDKESIREFAGDDIERAKYYPEDARFLIELEPTVSHYDAFEFGRSASAGTWRITI
jgi:heme-degrading monooxygenase HmoA